MVIYMLIIIIITALADFAVVYSLCLCNHSSNICAAGLATCVDLVSIANGVRVLTGTHEGDVVAFRCNVGYGLLGRRQLRCNGDGNWGLAWPRCLRGNLRMLGMVMENVRNVII